MPRLLLLFLSGGPRKLLWPEPKRGVVPVSSVPLVKALVSSLVDSRPVDVTGGRWAAGDRGRTVGPSREMLSDSDCGHCPPDADDISMNAVHSAALSASRCA